METIVLSVPLSPENSKTIGEEFEETPKEETKEGSDENLKQQEKGNEPPSEESDTESDRFEEYQTPREENEGEEAKKSSEPTVQKNRDFVSESELHDSDGENKDNQTVSAVDSDAEGEENKKSSTSEDSFDFNKEYNNASYKQKSKMKKEILSDVHKTLKHIAAIMFKKKTSVRELFEKDIISKKIGDKKTDLLLQ